VYATTFAITTLKAVFAYAPCPEEKSTGFKGMAGLISSMARIGRHYGIMARDLGTVSFAAPMGEGSKCRCRFEDETVLLQPSLWTINSRDIAT